MKRSIFALVSLLILLPSADAARDSVGRDFPVYDNGGKPDLTVDPKRLENQMQILDRYFDPVDDACVFAEFAVGGTGYRRLLRFDTVIFNGGDGDLIIGDRSDPPVTGEEGVAAVAAAEQVLQAIARNRWD